MATTEASKTTSIPTTTTTTTLKTTTPVTTSNTTFLPSEPTNAAADFTTSKAAFAEDTTFSELTTTDELTTHAAKSTTYLIVAIVLAVVVCIVVILVICFVTYKRGQKKKATVAAHMVADSRVTPKSNRPADGQRLSHISEGRIDQSANASAANHQSESKAGKSRQSHDNTRASIGVNIENETPRSSNVNKPDKSGAVANGGAALEPQYMNLVVLQSSPSKKGESPGKRQSGAKLVTSDQSRSRIDSHVSQSDLANTDANQSVYENLQNPDQFVNVIVKNEGPEEIIYQNTLQENNLYEVALKKEDTDIYVDMQ